MPKFEMTEPETPDAQKPKRALYKRRNGIDLRPSDPKARGELVVAVEVPIDRMEEWKKSEAAETITASVNADPAIQAALSLRAIDQSKADQGVGINEFAYELEKQCAAVRAGDMSRAEDMLLVQAHTLDRLYNKLIGLSILNLGVSVDVSERLMRLAFKAQSQCRTSLETLALLMNPPNVAFVRQANIANGPQQVNNGQAHAHAGEKLIPANKLLKGEGVGGERLESGTQGAAVKEHSRLATVEPIDRPKDARRQGAS